MSTRKEKNFNFQRTKGIITFDKNIIVYEASGSLNYLFYHLRLCYNLSDRRLFDHGNGIRLYSTNKGWLLSFPSSC